MKAARVLVLGFLLAGALAGTAIFAQQPPQPPEAPKDFNFAVTPPGAAYALFVDDQHAYHHLQGQAAELAQQLVKAETEEAKREIRKKLTDTLNQQFDVHTQQQQKELDELEKQITKLRSVLKKRQDAKSAIVDRRLEQMIQDAQGLGWQAPGSPHMGFSLTAPARINVDRPTPVTAPRPRTP
jgi:hypothetical protein